MPCGAPRLVTRLQVDDLDPIVEGCGKPCDNGRRGNFRDSEPTREVVVH